MQIEIDFDVFKALTGQRQSENHSYNDVLRGLLGLPEAADHTLRGRDVGGRFLPNGTELRSRHKGNIHIAEIISERLVYEGRTFPSASSAARAVTGTNVNGLTFWEVKRPGDVDWRKLSALPRDKQ